MNVMTVASERFRYRSESGLGSAGYYPVRVWKTRWGKGAVQYSPNTPRKPPNALSSSNLRFSLLPRMLLGLFCFHSQAVIPSVVTLIRTKRIWGAVGVSATDLTRHERARKKESCEPEVGVTGLMCFPTT